eukprot:1194203-Prorocentrum_minimum.AAC.3
MTNRWATKGCSDIFHTIAAPPSAGSGSAIIWTPSTVGSTASETLLAVPIGGAPAAGASLGSSSGDGGGKGSHFRSAWSSTEIPAHTSRNPSFRTQCSRTTVRSRSVKLLRASDAPWRIWRMAGALSLVAVPGVFYQYSTG